jgi:hypothetical protein
MNLTSEPLCVGYETKKTTYEAILIARDGVTRYTFGTDLAVYQACKEAEASTCLGHDQGSQTLYWSVFDEQIEYLNEVFIIPTLYATDYYGV